ncbi:MAG TPA: class I SAM-dependent methyltransferase [Solirubrobacterales bacterium]|nr:class I SAM-dependent methyltransferase [Solirubrobacterales bacterium]
MSSEALVEKPMTTGTGPTPGGAGLPEAGPWEQCFDLDPGRSTPVRDRGSRHLYYSLAETLRPVVLNARALADRPLRALVLGCDEGYLAHRLLEWGADRILAVDSRADALDRARFIREHRGIGPDRLELRLCADASALGIAAGEHDLVIADGRPARLGSWPDSLELIARSGTTCALIAPDRLQGATALSEAGFGKPALLEPPADAERRLVAFELNLLLARARETE